ncbi:unnamed protein product [Auanema sp. JU1783]|nr:unnamed protein product [Auanema sp. JU1783]
MSSSSYQPSYYLPAASASAAATVDQLRSCLQAAAMSTVPSNSNSSTPFSIENILSARIPFAIPQLPLNEMFPQPWTASIPAPYIFPPNLMTANQFMPNCFPTFHFSGKRKRRHRTIFSEDQLNILEETFTNTHYPDVAQREKLAVQCDLKEERVEVWFKNRRAKERKQNRESTSLKSSGS